MDMKKSSDRWWDGNILFLILFNLSKSVHDTLSWLFILIQIMYLKQTMFLGYIVLQLFCGSNLW
jgi:hypothetical protein